MPIVDVIRKRAKKLPLERPGVAVRNEGYASEGPPDPLTISAHAQPLSPKEIRDLPPGQNATDWRNIWSEEEMIFSDRITSEGKKYTVKRIEYWPEGPFYRAAAVKTEDVLT